MIRRVRFGSCVVAAVILLNLVACGNAKNIGVAATQTRSAELGELATKTREIELTQVAMALRTPTPLPTPPPTSTPTPPPTAIPIPPTATPTTAVPTLPRPTATAVPPKPSAPPAPPSATATPASQAIAGCGGGSVRVGSNMQLSNDLAQWNRIVDVVNPIVKNWNAFLKVSDPITKYGEAAGNAEFITAADNYLRAAPGALAPLQAETATGRFAPLATRQIAAINAEIRWISLQFEAATQEDVDAWNAAIDFGETIDAAQMALKTELDIQCVFWNAYR